MSAILIVDDDPLCAEELAEALDLESLSVDWTESPFRALAMADELRPTLRLVITDMRMPEMDGTELVASLHARYPHLRFVILTGHAPFVSEPAGEGGHVLARMAKPLAVGDLVALLRREGL